jgi:hypothetical protein
MKLDRNAIAETLMGVFGREMTTEFGTARALERAAWSASFRVYRRTPGKVARCRH